MRVWLALQLEHLAFVLRYGRPGPTDVVVMRHRGGWPSVWREVNR